MTEFVTKKTGVRREDVTVNRITVDDRVKSQRGIEFRRWANKVLKDYIIKGYAINDKRLEALQKTVKIQAKMLATAIEGDSNEVLRAVKLK